MEDNTIKSQENLQEIEQVNEQESEQENEKKLTQNQVDEIIKKRLAKERQKAQDEIKKNKDYKEYIAWKESNKTDLEKQEEKLNNLSQENEKFKKELSYLKSKELVAKKGIDNKFQNYVTYEVNNMVNENMDFEDALNIFLEKNSDLFETNNNTNTKIKTGIKQGQSKQKVSGVEEIFFNRNPRLKKKLIE